MYDYHIKQSMDQPGKGFANPARGQLNRENEYFSVPVRAVDFGPAGRVRPSRPASACSFSIFRLNHQSSIWCLLMGFLPISAAASTYLFEPPYAIESVPSLSGHAIAYRWRLLPRVRRKGPVVFKVVPVTGAAFASRWSELMRTSRFSTFTIGAK